jgi:hypothetical protein
VTPERFALAMIVFHAIVVGFVWVVLDRWRDPTRCRLPSVHWCGALARDVAIATLATYPAALVVAFVANVDDARRFHIGEISLRLLGQALFGEAILLGVGLAWTHRRARRFARATVMGATAAVLVVIYAEAYRIEPRTLRVRHHVVGVAGDAELPTIRILHLTDIQTPSIGAHEERALRKGLAERPDLIILTGDYVQDALGRPTEDQAAHDLRALMARIGFDAPLGIFATEGDVGPPCREVFADTRVRCVVDANVMVALPHGGTLGITGLSGGRGRERNPAWLAWLLSKGPGADHRIVISHSPDFVDAMPVNVDLVLAGHTHGG